MLINVFGKTTGNSLNILDTSSLVEKPYLRTNYLESKTWEYVDLKTCLSRLMIKEHLQEFMLIISLTIHL